MVERETGLVLERERERVVYPLHGALAWGRYPHRPGLVYPLFRCSHLELAAAAFGEASPIMGRGSKSGPLNAEGVTQGITVKHASHITTVQSLKGELPMDK